jgi:hypothetical protein
MSREVRRVPVGWKHPLEYNQHWEFQASTSWGRKRPLSWLHAPDEKFVPLYGESFTPAHQEWEAEKAKWEAGEHDSLQFSLRYHSAEGFLNRDGEREEPRPYVVYAEDGETVIREFYPSTVEEILEVYPYSDYATEPTPETHMPDFGIPEDELGWVLYETVSEGTPCTPVFATADELIEHLSIIGQDWDQVPMRREAAAALVGNGYSVGSMMVVGGTLYQSDMDADLIDALPSAGALVVEGGQS